MGTKDRNERDINPNSPDGDLDEEQRRRAGTPDVSRVEQTANPPRTTTGKVTTPKFGSAGSGGAEFEGPLPKD